MCNFSIASLSNHHRLHVLILSCFFKDVYNMCVSRPCRIMQNISAGLPSFLRALGKNIFPWIWVLPELGYCVCRIKVSVFWMAVNWRTCLAPRGCFLDFVHSHRSQKHQKMSYPSLTAVMWTTLLFLLPLLRTHMSILGPLG